MKTPSEILAKHEDNNEMHFHQVDREWIIEAMEEFALEFAEAAVENWGLTKVERIYLEGYYRKITQ
jgi:predicted ATP-grasp superfamily ATP-dependent carboligase